MKTSAEPQPKQPRANANTKHRVWVCIQRSAPDGSEVKGGDYQWDLNLSPGRSFSLAWGIIQEVKKAKAVQREEDKLLRRGKSAGRHKQTSKSAQSGPTPPFPGKR